MVVSPPAVRIALHGGSPTIRAGLGGMLRSHLGVTHVERSEHADVVLVDMDSRAVKDPLSAIEHLVSQKLKVAAFSWRTQAIWVHTALGRGAVGYLYKGIRGRDLARSAIRMAAGEVVVHIEATSDRIGHPPDARGRREPSPGSLVTADPGTDRP